jgi:hypothetical protein
MIQRSQTSKLKPQPGDDKDVEGEEIMLLTILSPVAPPLPIGPPPSLAAFHPALLPDSMAAGTSEQLLPPQYVSESELVSPFKTCQSTQF